jgi:hypothetical protein
MADSGQQSTAGSELDTLVNDIFDMMSDMKIRKIDIGSERLYLNKLLRDKPSLPPEVSADRMRKFMSMLQKTVQDASNAAAADKPDRSAPTAAIGHTHGEVDSEGEVEGEQPGGVYCGARADVREDTKAKCEAIRAFGLVYIREQLAAVGEPQRQLTYHRLCEAYDNSLGVQAKALEWVFGMKYLWPTMFRCARFARAESLTTQLRRSLPRLGQGSLAKSEPQLIGVLQTCMPLQVYPRSVTRKRPCVDCGSAT